MINHYFFCARQVNHFLKKKLVVFLFKSGLFEATKVRITLTSPMQNMSLIGLMLTWRLYVDKISLTIFFWMVYNWVTLLPSCGGNCSWPQNKRSRIQSIIKALLVFARKGIKNIAVLLQSKFWSFHSYLVQIGADFLLLGMYYHRFVSNHTLTPSPTMF